MPEASDPPVRSRGLRFALLAHPSVQAVRFATKLALPWFFTTQEYGEAILPSLIVFGLQHVAVFGLDEALVSARGIDAGLWQRMRRFQDRLGFALALLLVVAGFALQGVAGQELLGKLLMGLAPMLVVANRATLPTWLLVRERRFFDLFCVDLGSVLAFALVTVVAASAGFGAWSLVAGWSANAVAALLLSSWRSRDLVPRGPADAADWPGLRRTGGHLTTAAVLGYVGERVDSAATGFVLGRGALGLFENAQNLSGVLLGWGQSVADRYLFPTLAAHERAEGSGRGYLRALRTTILYVLPPHAVLALASDPIVRTVFPSSWHASGPLLRCLALAAAARCVDLLAVTALKATGAGRAVVRLGWMRLALVVLALAIALPHGLEIVVVAVLASRVVAAALALATTSRHLDLAEHRGAERLGRAGLAFAAWAIAIASLALWLQSSCADWPPIALLFVIGIVAAGLWVLARLAFDGQHARADLALARSRFERGTAP
ncbi:MAG: oligosaccharide flippase family protein [Planctomycetota bacterium]|nr:oligosaccharide flippase family protein [Planctomycetota bacterium]